jgi:hypothetical protein
LISLTKERIALLNLWTLPTFAAFYSQIADIPLLRGYFIVVCLFSKPKIPSLHRIKKNDGGGPIVSKKEKEKENKKKRIKKKAACSLLYNGGCCIFLMRRIGGGAACRRAICGVDQFSNCSKTLASKVPKSANVIRNGTVQRSRFSTQEYFILYQENPRFHRGVP